MRKKQKKKQHIKQKQILKKLDINVIVKEMNKFFSERDYHDVKEIKRDIKNIKIEFVKYLKDKNYDVVLETIYDIFDKVVKDSSLPKNIGKLSEKLNENLGKMDVFSDTTQLIPGSIGYVVKSVPPTKEKPYPTYLPQLRVITQIHDNGVNGGTVFFSFDHKQVYDDMHTKKVRIISEELAFYSVLTEQQAKYTCKLLNLQSKKTYLEAVKELKQTEKTK